MAKKRNLTVFQRLNNIFGPDGVNVPRSQTNRYAIGSTELLTTKSKEEFDTDYMQELFDYGYKQMINGYHWKQTLPGFE